MKKRNDIRVPARTSPARPSPHRSPHAGKATWTSLCLLALLISLLAVATLTADDRDLLRQTAGKPYVFVIMDTSGSMNWTPPCDHVDAMTDIDPFDGMCTSTCPMEDDVCAKVCPNKGCEEYFDTGLPDPNDPDLAPIIIDNADTGKVTVTVQPVLTSTPTGPSPGGVSGWVANTYRARAYYTHSSDNFFDTSSNLPGTTTLDPSNDTAIIAGQEYWVKNTGGSTINTTREYKVAVRFAQNLPKAGRYHVYNFFVERSVYSGTLSETNDAVPTTEARVQIEYYDGSNTRTRYLEVDQRAKLELPQRQRFAYLGTFEFKANASGVVPAAITLTNLNEAGLANISSATAANIVAKGQIMADAVAFVPVPDKDPAVACKTTDEVYLCRQPLCPDGDCVAPSGGDDPTSKFFQAKQAIYEVMKQINDVDFGFASYEQDNVHVKFKHWLYRVKDGTAPIFNFQDGAVSGGPTIPFPEPGRIDNFGTGPNYNSGGYTTEGDNRWDCSTSTTTVSTDPGYDDDHFVGCTSKHPADLRDRWEMDRLRYIPKMGKNGGQETSLYVRTYVGATETFPSWTDADGPYRTYRIDWEPNGSQYDLSENSILIKFDVIYCKNITADPECSNGTYSTTVADNQVIEYQLVNENVPWSYRIERYPMTGQGFFDFREGLNAAETCSGLEENDDWDYNIAPYSSVPNVGGEPAGHSYDDAWWAYPFKRPWFRDPRGGFNPAGAAMSPRTDAFDSGDFIPWDWANNDNNLSIRKYLAPNITKAPGDEPDFRFSPYFHDKTLATDLPGSYDRKLRLRDDLVLSSAGDPADLDDDVYVANSDTSERRRPLVPYGSTPLLNSMKDFKLWYDKWVPYAEVFDLDWECRPKYVIFLTDGDETCSTGNPLPICASGNPIETLSGYAAAKKVKTYVIGYGIPGGGNALTCMAEDGLTGPNNTPGKPILPRNKDELVEELTNIFNAIRTESFAFASASIPAVQSTSADKIYLSSFTPLQGRSLWPGRLDAFRQPLPLTKNRKPDVTFACLPSRESGCHLWDAAEKLLSQAPTETQATSTPPQFKLGMNLSDNRRIFYGQANPDRDRQALRLLFPPEGSDPAALLDKKDMAEVFLDPVGYKLYLDGTLTEAEVTTSLREVVGNMLMIKEALVPVGPDTKFSCTGGATSTPAKCRYVMGDIFHANPSVITGPSNFAFFKDDLCGLGGLPSRPNNCVAGSTVDRGYREFVARTIWRRRMLMAATNDGQLHFFDAGVYTKTSTNVPAFTDGTGYELFSYMPRLAMPAVREQAINTKHVYSLDGTVTVGDVYIDPLLSPPAQRAQKREWRTVLIGGMREGGDVFSQTLHVEEPLKSGYFAIDLTQPDRFENASPNPPRNPEAPNLGVPTCLKYDTATGKQVKVAGCETLSGEQTYFPMELWTFQDQITHGGYTLYLDEDDNDVQDLGATWSTPVIGQIAVCETDCSPANVTTRWVAIFGGGFDPYNKLAPKRGTYLYMVDIETGDVIYKYPLNGAVPSNPAVLDVDRDGLLDIIYIGTTNGFLYKVDLRKATIGSNPDQYPTLENYVIQATRVLNPAPSVPWPATVQVKRIIDPHWAPFKILATGTTDVSDDGAPIFYPPAMFYIPDLNLYGGLLLVGDREDLWAPAVKNYKSRVMVFVDDGKYTSSDDIILASRLQFVDYKGGGDPTADYLHITETTAPIKMRGWYMDVPDLVSNTQHWRATSEPFLVTGVAIFSLFDPYSKPSTSGSGVVCQRQGNTFGFALFIKNGNPLIPLPTGSPNDCSGSADLCCGGRCFRIDEFTTAIHSTSTVTKNRPPEARTDGGSYYGEEELTVGAAQAAMLDAIRDAIMDAMPNSCQYNEKYEISFAVLRNSTGLNELARVPMMVCPSDWKD